jgi:hypothetical protein
MRQELVDSGSFCRKYDHDGAKQPTKYAFPLCFFSLIAAIPQ